jgi:hypothetical protein
LLVTSYYCQIAEISASTITLFDVFLSVDYLIWWCICRNTPTPTPPHLVGPVRVGEGGEVNIGQCVLGKMKSRMRKGVNLEEKGRKGEDEVEIGDKV